MLKVKTQSCHREPSEYFTQNDYSLLSKQSRNSEFSQLPVQWEFGLCSTSVSCYSVYPTDSENSDNTHQTYEIISISECAECVCLYKPVSGLALFFPSVVSRMKKTKGEKSVLHLIQRAPHRHIPERESLTCTSFGHAQSELRTRVRRRRERDVRRVMCFCL